MCNSTSYQQKGQRKVLKSGGERSNTRASKEHVFFSFMAKKILDALTPPVPPALVPTIFLPLQKLFVATRFDFDLKISTIQNPLF